MPMFRKLGAAALLAVPLVAGSVALAPSASAHGPDDCVIPYVWRDARPGDRVCVPVATGTQAAADNAAHAGRVQPGGGAYGPNTCRPGFVWRDAFADDQICVTPQARAQAAADNQPHPERLVVRWYHRDRPVRSGQVAGAARVDLRPDGIYDIAATVLNTGYPSRKVAVACGVPLLNGRLLALAVAGDVPALSTNTTLGRRWRDSRVVRNWSALSHDMPLTCVANSTLPGARADVRSLFPGRPVDDLDELEPFVPLPW